MSETDKILKRLNLLLDKIEPLLPNTNKSTIEFNGGCYFWQTFMHSGFFQKITDFNQIKLNDLQCIDSQKQIIERNTQQFLANLPANNVLLWGPKGSGKSSLIKALFNKYIENGLNIIEIEKKDLSHLRNIIEQLRDQKKYFIIYCDDLSFEHNDSNYKNIKVILDGSLISFPKNVLIYATSNRRHLIPEAIDENMQTSTIKGELHLSEAVEEKISLSERFGIWLAFHPFDQDQYLQIVDHWLKKLGYNDSNIEKTHKESIKWAIKKGSRSGRTAWQFAKDFTGQYKYELNKKTY